MSEMPPEPQQGGGNFFTHKYGGIPGVVWLAGAAVVAYFLFFRNKGSGSGDTSSGGGGTPTTGDITLQPGTTTIDTGGSAGGIDNPAPVSGGDAPGNPGDTDTPPGTGTPNPQPHPVPPPRKKSHHKKVTHPAAPAGDFVTVGQWPGSSVNGLAQWNTTLSGIAKHSHTSVANLLKLNPWIKNPNLLHPGQKVRIK